MNHFDFFMPPQVRFGAGRLDEAGDLVAKIGQRCLVVSGPSSSPLDAIADRALTLLKKNNVAAFKFAGVVANPTRESIESGMALAAAERADCVLAVGGGSAIDTAKIIALLFSRRDKLEWDKLCTENADPFRLHLKPVVATLPLIAVPTTSGSGSHVTQAAVVTDKEKKEKQTIFHRGNFPSLSIVDPELMVSMPGHVTAATGFDAFSHAFESYLGDRLSPLTEWMALAALRLIVVNLPQAVRHPADLGCRTSLAWADTLAGMCLANAGAAIPHPLGEIVGGICPHLAHGETLAMVYPEFIESLQVEGAEKFARIAKTIRPDLEDLSTLEASGMLRSEMDRFLKEIDLWRSLHDPRIGEADYDRICSSGILDGIGAASRSDLLRIIHASRERVIHELP